MKIENATPPADFPEQVIMMDKDLAQRYPNKAFYLRVTLPNDEGVDHIDLDGAHSPIQARRMAIDKGYNPTHWMEVTGSLNRFY